MDHAYFMKLALEEAQIGYDTGGVPVGAVLVEGGDVIGRGYNKRWQEGDPTAHGEMDCLRNAGRRRRYDTTTLYTTLSPCMMCAGTITQFGIKHVVIGEEENFFGNANFLRDRGVKVTVLDDPVCKALMARFITEKPELWDEDIAGNDPS